MTTTPGTDIRALDESQRDALREVANIGAGHAATALSLMTSAKILISVPTIAVAPIEELAPLIAKADEIIAAIPMEVQGTLHGQTILALPLTTAHRLAAIMLRRDAQFAAILTELEASALTEAGNILAGAYMNALSDFMRMTLLPSPPTLHVGPARDVLRAAGGALAEPGGYVFCVETEFLIDDADGKLPGYFLLLPDAASLTTMLEAVQAL